jgi:hypothetical protein
MNSDRAAEARKRREKILARQKDRLSTITGVYSKQEGEWLPTLFTRQQFWVHLWAW